MTALLLYRSPPLEYEIRRTIAILILFMKTGILV